MNNNEIFIILSLCFGYIVVGFLYGLIEMSPLEIEFVLQGLGGIVGIYLLYMRFKTADDIKINQEKQFHLNNQYKNFLETSKLLTDKDSTIEARISALYLLYNYTKNYPKEIEKVYQLLGEYIKPLLGCINDNCNNEEYSNTKTSSNTGIFRAVEYKYTEKKVLDLDVYNQENNLQEIINKWQISGTTTEKEISIALIMIRDLTANILPHVNEHIELSNIIIFNLDKEFYSDLRFKSTIKPTYNLIFLECNLKEVDFSDSKFYYCKFINCDLDGANFSNCELNHTIFYNSDLSGVDLRKAKLYITEFKACKFKNKDISGTNFKNCSLIKKIEFNISKLDGLKFKNIDLANIKFKDCINEPQS